MLNLPAPPSAAVKKILIWHQGALGDLLLAGPALAALGRHYAGARFTGLGQPEPWGLLAPSLPLEEVWNSGEARWGHLFRDGDLPPALRDRLARFQLALIFGRDPQPVLQDRLRRAGIPAVFRLPSFPETGAESLAALQARHLASLGLNYVPLPLELELGPDPEGELPELPGAGPWLAVAPGSGSRRKNWPLPLFYEVSRALSWEYRLRVVWLAGPAEAEMLPYLEALTQAQGQALLANRPLARVARVLARCRLYIGNDSGLTHLAAAVAGPEVLALFGPTDPRIWAPMGRRVRVLRAPCPQVSEATTGAIASPETGGLEALALETVHAAAVQVLGAPNPVGRGG